MSEGRAHVGAVVIGRNEGERLRTCLESLRGLGGRIIYVDSGSTDGSVDTARAVGVDVVELDMTAHFTAARARNAGAAQLLERCPSIEFIQFVDGDCEVDPEWIDTALAAMGADEWLAVACGRRRERKPDMSRYNRLCDIEWNTPVGPAKACGGDALVRVAAFRDVGGYRDSLIAGEEPEMCFRMRQRSWRIERLDSEMTLHDAAMTRFGQWWKRARRSGYAYAEGFALHGKSPERYRAKEVRSIMFWGVILPAPGFAGAWWTWGVSVLIAAGLYGVLWLRVRRACRSRTANGREARLYATFCVLAKFAEMTGVAASWWNRVRGRQGTIIEYKEASVSRSGRATLSA